MSQAESVGWSSCGSTPAPAEESLVAAIGRRTGGNPLFIGEVLRSVGREAITEILDDPRSVVIPHRVHEAIGRRLGHLSQRCVDTLTLASVLGREFDLAPLARLSGLSVDSLYNVLDEALAEEVIGEAPSRCRTASLRPRVDSRHPLRRAHASAPCAHRQAAEALESLFAAAPELHLAELAYHFLAAIPAAPAARAVEYATRAGDRALALLAYEEAARQYASALDALELGERPTGCASASCCSRWETPSCARAPGQTAKDAFLRAAGHARAEGTAEQLARAALGYGTRYIWPRAADPKIIKLLEEALEALGEGDSAPRVRVMTRLACALRPARERPASLSRDAVEMARRLGDLPTLAYALDGRYAAIWWPETAEERLAIASELTDVAERANEPSARPPRCWRA